MMKPEKVPTERNQEIENLAANLQSGFLEISERTDMSGLFSK